MDRSHRLTRDTPIDEPVWMSAAAALKVIDWRNKAAVALEAAGERPPGTAKAMLANDAADFVARFLGTLTQEDVVDAVKTIKEAPVETRQQIRQVARDAVEAAVVHRSRRFPTSTALSSMLRRRTRRFAPRPRESRAGRGGFARSLSPPAEEPDEPHPPRLVVALLRAVDLGWRT